MAGVAGTRRLLAVTSPFQLWATALSHGWHALAPFKWDPSTDTLTRSDRLPSGHVYAIQMQPAPSSADGVCNIMMECRPKPSASDLQILDTRTRRMLRLDEDFSDFHARCRRSKTLMPIAVLGGGRLLRSPDIWEDLVKGICTTNVTWQRTQQMVEAIAKLGPTPSGSHQSVFPTPEEVLNAGSSYLTEHAGVGYRAKSILALAESVVDKKVDLTSFQKTKISDATRVAALEDLPGIGPITARYLAMLCGSYRDLALDSSTRLFAIRTFGETDGDPEMVSQRFSSFGRWRALAFWCLHWLHWPHVQKRIMDDLEK